MKTDKFIHLLAEKSAPVKPLAAPLRRIVPAFLGAFFCVAIGVALIGLRTDLDEAVWEFSFIAQALAAVGLAGLSAISAFLMSVPGRSGPWVRTVPFVTVGIWLLVIVVEVLSGGESSRGFHFTCMRDIMVLAVIPGAYLFFMLKRAAPLDLERTGIFAALAAGSLGALGVQFICHEHRLIHMLLWHYLPVMGVGILGAWLGRRLLRW
jgi:hypothetical protein